MTSRDSQQSKHAYTVAALYKFVALPDYASLQQPLLDICVKNDVMGTLLLAHEGINGTIAGSPQGVESVLNWLRSNAPFSDLDVKLSHADAPPFYRMKVRLKKEIVTLGVAGLDAANEAGTYVNAEDWNDLISREDVVLVDTRNDYEVAIGTFAGAENPGTGSFRELPKWVDERLKAAPDTKVAMFCTGGIRCEKSTALLKAKGYENVFHLKGGILKYLETVPEEESLWKGECFVFDQRVSVKHGLEVGDYDMCHACRMPISETDKQSCKYLPGISCIHCHDTMDEKQRERFAERQKQIELAAKRDEKHIAADVAVAKRAKREKLARRQGESRQSDSA